MKLYVGNLSYDSTEDDLRDAFSNYGEVASVSVITDRDTGRPKGFAFVEMANSEDGRAAIENLNGTELAGRQIKVDEARPREEGGSRRGGGGGRRGGGGYRDRW